MKYCVVAIFFAVDYTSCVKALAYEGTQCSLSVALLFPLASIKQI